MQVLQWQFPIRPAAVKTIHRCQGDSLDEAVVDSPASTREHMHYVGLSWVRNSSAQHVRNLNENKIKVSEKVKDETKRLKTEASLLPLAILDCRFTQNKNNLISKCQISPPPHRWCLKWLQYSKGLCQHFCWNKTLLVR